MSDFFKNPEDLSAWIKSRKSPDEATLSLMNIIKEDVNDPIPDDEQEISDTCKAIYDEEDAGSAAKLLFGVLARHNITTLRKAANMKKEAQAVESRQRNNWVRGERNKWNRCVDGFNEGTPWRLERDKMYNFTHYYTDNVQFDEDPKHVYSGEAIWRMYVMDKFYRDYQNDKGEVVGGYINDRFYRFPTAGTPSNPDVDRFGGNPLMLGKGEKTRKPRPHQYSTERRLEEARGNKTYDLEATAKSSHPIIKISSKMDVADREHNNVYKIFRDTLDMREAGVDYATMLKAIAHHYGTTVLNVEEIDRVAQGLKSKHNGMIYAMDKKAQSQNWMDDGSIAGRNIRIDGDNVVAEDLNGNAIGLNPGTIITKVPGNDNVFEIVSGSPVGTKVKNIVFENGNSFVSMSTPIQDDATELGLNESANELSDGNVADNSNDVPSDEASLPQDDFNITDM